jgi:release factor glutamine methyltransferase
MTSVYELVAEARQRLIRAGLTPAGAALDAEVLARHALGWDRARLLAHGREGAPDGFQDRFRALVERRARREPVAFITGIREFWGLDFEVSSDVLIPRPETELIIEAVLDERPDRASVRRIVDVGTGSGCLAVALAREFPHARVVAIDVSAAALAVAARNTGRHAVNHRVSLVQADLLESIAGPVDVIVSNPPYVPVSVSLSADIVRFEPAIALYAGELGLTALERLIASARSRLAADGLFVVEFGFGQAEQVAGFAAGAGWRGVSTKDDLQAIPRVAVMKG